MFLEIVLLLLGFVAFWHWKTKDLPPGPLALEIIWKIVTFNKRGLKGIISSKTVEKYGPIAYFGLLGRGTVVINDFSIIKEQFTNETFNGRRNDAFIKTCKSNKKGEPLGIVANWGTSWKEQRRFSIKSLKDFGLASSKLDGIISDGAQDVINMFESEMDSESVLRLETQFNGPIINTLWRIVGSSNFKYNDPKFIRMLESVTELFKTGHKRNPILELFKKDKSFDIVKEHRAIFREEIKEHQEHLDVNSPADLMDAYLIEMKLNPALDLDHLEVVVCDLFHAGSETSSTSLRWILMYLAIYPEVQQKCIEEIHSVIGDRAPVSNDMNSLPYVQATIWESLRVSSVVPTTLIHRAIKDSYVRGYFIPKDTYILGNISYLNSSKTIYKSPEKFDPNNFLQDGNAVKPEGFMPFGFGKRVCMGESLAKKQIFMFTIAILQKYEITESPNHPSLDPSKFEIGITAMPDPFYIQMKCR